MRLKILDAYIIKRFLFTFVFIIGLMILISMIFDFSEKLDAFINNKAPARSIIFDYYLNFIPYLLNLFSPLIIFISAIYFTSRMASNTEFVAILSAGTNYYRLLLPYFIVALLLASFSWYLNAWVIPKGNVKLIQFEETYLRRTTFSGGGYIHRQISPDVFIYMRHFNPDTKSGIRFSLEHFEGVQLKYKILSQQIVWIDSLEEWDIQHYTLRKINGLHESVKTGKSMIVKLPMEPSDFGKKTANIQTMNNRELSKFIKKEKLRGAEMVNYYIIEKSKRLSMPFSTFILVLIAYSIASRKMRGGTGWHLAIGIMLAFSYILFLQFSVVFSTKGSLNPNIAVWIPNMLYAVLGCILLAKAQK